MAEVIDNPVNDETPETPETCEENLRKRGRPRKKEYDEAEQMRQLLDRVDAAYDETGELVNTAKKLGMSNIRLKKLLITSGKLKYPETEQIQQLLKEGKSIDEIGEILGLKKSSINSYLPYSKIAYKTDETSANAERCDLFRKRKAAVREIRDADSLEKCIDLFCKYKFPMPSGEKFSYTVSSDYLSGEPAMIIEMMDRNDSNYRILRLASVIEAYELIRKGKLSPEKKDEWESDYIRSIFDRFGLNGPSSKEL